MHYTTWTQGGPPFQARRSAVLWGPVREGGSPMTTTSEIILLDISDRIATVTLNRPERLNALNGELLDMLPGVIQKVTDDEDARCLVLTGAGRGFCAGGDIAGMASGEPLRQEDPGARLRRN